MRITHVHPLSSVIHHALNLAGELAEVGGEDGRGDDGVRVRSAHGCNEAEKSKL